MTFVSTDTAFCAKLLLIEIQALISACEAEFNEVSEMSPAVGMQAELDLAVM